LITKTQRFDGVASLLSSKQNRRCSDVASDDLHQEPIFKEVREKKVK